MARNSLQTARYAVPTRFFALKGLMPPMGLLDRYILRSVATPLTLALCTAAALLLIEHMLRLFDFVLAEQGPVDVVWRMLANLVPHYLSLALPLGAFLGVLLAFRNLSMSSELDAMKSSGASFGRLLRPSTACSYSSRSSTSSLSATSNPTRATNTTKSASM